jgi:hypothetical protein
VDRKYVGGPRLTVEHAKRTIGKHPALAAPYGKSKTVEEITVAQRKLSPHFPTIAEAYERRIALRETITARVLLFGVAAGLLYGGWDSFGYVVAGMSLLGFTITCFVAGNRHDKKGQLFP